MIKKIKLDESVNLCSSEIYNSIAILGYMCTLAANDLHHIHLCGDIDWIGQRKNLNMILMVL